MFKKGLIKHFAQFWESIGNQSLPQPALFLLNNFQLMTYIPVTFRPYYDACYHDTCACDMGGDCECTCSAVAAYAEACNAAGVHVKWRTQKFCRKYFEY